MISCPKPLPADQNSVKSPSAFGAKPMRPATRSALQAGPGVDQLPGRHRAGVVGAAFDVVPRIAARAVVAVAGGANDVEPLVDQAAHDHVRGRHVFDAGPHFLGIGRGDHRLAHALGIGRDQQSAFVLIGVVAARVEMVLEARAGSCWRARPSAPSSTLPSSRKPPSPATSACHWPRIWSVMQPSPIWYFSSRMLVGPVGLHEAVGEHAGLAAGVERRSSTLLSERSISWMNQRPLNSLSSM